MEATTDVVSVERPGFRPSRAGIAARVVVAVLIAAGVLLLPALLGAVLEPGDAETWNRQISLAAIFAIIGLSVNVITGHAGQISLGHQAFVGIGAFMSAFISARLGVVPFAPSMPTANFFVAVLIAGAMGGLMAFLLGLVALRIRGLYLALITLAFGLMAETTIFNWRPFTGGGAGATAPRPAAFESEQGYAYAAFIFLGLFLFVDWRLVKTKAGRAIVALRNDDRVASTLGVNVTGYKLLAFVLAGVMAGVAGALFAHRTTIVQAADFELRFALVWVIMAVVGGLGSRAGVVIGSAFFAMFEFIIGQLGFLSETGEVPLPFFGPTLVFLVVPLLGAVLLLLTLTLYPGGIGQQLLPIRRWLAGGPFVEHRRHGGRRRKRKAARPADAKPETPAQAAAAAIEPTGSADGSGSADGADRAETEPIPPVADGGEVTRTGRGGRRRS